MEIVAASVVLYFVEPFGAIIFILLTANDMYDPAQRIYVILALLLLAIVRRLIVQKES